MNFNELSEIGEVAQSAIGELQELMPDDARVKGVLMVVEMEYECDDCGNPHEYCYVVSNTSSTAYDKGLLKEATDALATRGDMVAGAEHSDDD